MSNPKNAAAFALIEQSKLDDADIDGPELRMVLWDLIARADSAEATVESFRASHDERVAELRAALGGE